MTSTCLMAHRRPSHSKQGLNISERKEIRMCQNTDLSMMMFHDTCHYLCGQAWATRMEKPKYILQHHSPHGIGPHLVCVDTEQWWGQTHRAQKFRMKCEKHDIEIQHFTQWQILDEHSIALEEHNFQLQKVKDSNLIWINWKDCYLTAKYQMSYKQLVNNVMSSCQAKQGRPSQSFENFSLQLLFTHGKWYVYALMRLPESNTCV